MEECFEHGARSELILRWSEAQTRVRNHHADDTALIEAMESLRAAINQYFQAIGWVPDELPPYGAGTDVPAEAAPDLASEIPQRNTLMP